MSTVNTPPPALARRPAPRPESHASRHRTCVMMMLHQLLRYSNRCYNFNFCTTIVLTTIIIMNFIATKAYYSSSASDIVQHQWIHEGNKFITTRRKDGTIIVAPSSEQRATATIIFIHGLGDSSKGWVDVAEVRFTRILRSSKVAFFLCMHILLYYSIYFIVCVRHTIYPTIKITFDLN